jgi:hypothetical protein
MDGDQAKINGLERLFEGGYIHLTTNFSSVSIREFLE